MSHIDSLCAGMDMSAFAERLRLLLEARNLSQVRLSELLGVDPCAYNRWEKGATAPHLDTVIKIADVLQVTLDELVGRKAVSEEVKIHNHTLHTLWQKADMLPDSDQQPLIAVLDSFVKKSMVEQVIGFNSNRR
ncbi:helix-turn-helix domain-containing protein [Yersinia pseudotuberculosis]|uniref:XRE family transcriptional regulator n=2 Tax=Yersinia pseudotuberculosis TaxID=633 RepID=A0ABM7AJR5_YERPU|nr:helix-turn-helix transcriptional regulator [Yersinia pseudotuberculosis]AJJ60497.1 helix-turn-helix family protein [Yersinia pseudotuberculosis YPIII]AYW87630.1 XRE family transcriptional regulator [Yersinia pseudotuberculosis]AYW92708.1 XRE family transcriptional regulator [Yersinia pseudotuberculosis]AYW96930.1 XRE family transcriptional regulator [Yersinia pseudotuberculosis]AYX02183.1 XRE family transcriptional regulator [Yersinia pseudotuberculosis]